MNTIASATQRYMIESFLSEKTALVTGSTQGIGLAIAVRLARAGAAIALHGLATAAQAAEAEAMARAAGAADVCFFDSDLRDPAAIASMMRTAEAWKGHLDILVNNAGIQYTAPLIDMPPERWDAIIAVNLSAAFHTMRHAIPGMIERGFGRIVNLGSVHGLVASKDKGAYVASKFGLVGLTRTAALECASAGSRASGAVTVNCIAPGFTDTPIIEPQIEARAPRLGGDREAALRELLLEKEPSLRISTPSEIAEAVAMLCQPWTHNLTGVTLPIDGGWTAQ